jgi:ergothioneine biosynthesis protein EgtB
MTSIATTGALDRPAMLDRYVRIRARTQAFFDLLDESLYYERPIALRNPVVFYEGHLPAFSVNVFLKHGLLRRGVDEHLEVVFARGIDPESEAAAVARGNPAWPSRDAVRAYGAEVDRLMTDAIAHADLEGDDERSRRAAASLWTILEHEEMHQETLAYMWHQVPYAHKRKPAGYETLPAAHGATPCASTPVRIPGGRVTLGTDLRDAPFAWDNERPAHAVTVEAFTIDAHNVTNAAFMAFVEAGGYQEPRWWRAEDWAWLAAEAVTHPPFWERDGGAWYWRGMFERVPLPASWPVYVSWAEARAYASWRGRQLPTEGEFHRAAFGTHGDTERLYPWGDALPRTPPSNFDYERWDPEPAGFRPEAASAFAVHDLVGNGWEWTSTIFGPFEGFTPIPSYPEYSADFFDGEHFVMKGASPLTARGLVRRGFRNWFRPRYPYVYAAFRCAGPA